MRGYFGIGIEAVSKAMNAGSLFRTAHAFGASFVFTVAAAYPRRHGRRADTSDTEGHVPYYAFPDVDSLLLPRGCQMVGVELIDGAGDLPSFHHPQSAAYVLGPERGALSPAMIDRCDHVIRIPTRFCVNVAVAGAIVMYDRLLSLGRFAARPQRPGAAHETPPLHVHGGPRFRRDVQRYQAPPPTADG